MSSEFRLPGVTLFGWGAVARVGEEAAALGRRALLVTGRSAMRKTGFADRVRTLLEEHRVAVVVFDQVEPDPASATVDRGAEVARDERCDLVVGLGGGSPMDAARAIAAIAAGDDSIRDYLDGKAVEGPGLPLVNIATTSGTASEITAVSVLLHEDRRLKLGIRSPHWFARVAVVDPELTMTMPPEVTAATGLDALTHAIESYLSTGATEPSEALAMRAIELVARSLRAATADGGDRAAREAMALGSMTAGMAFANSGLGLVHGLVHPIGARFGLSHGMACGRLLPYVMEHNLPAVEEKLARVGAVVLGKPEATAEEAIAAVEQLLDDLGVPSGLGDVPFQEDQIGALAEDTLVSGAVKTNPRPVSEKDAEAVLRRAWKS